MKRIATSDIYFPCNAHTGKRSGYGKLTMNGEVVFEGQWEDDAPVYDESARNDV